MAKPPLTYMTEPVMKSDACEARNIAAPAIPRFAEPACGRAQDYLLNIGPVCAPTVMSVAIHPGTIALTWTLWGASSIAIVLVVWTSAPFAAAYGIPACAPNCESSLAI